MKRSSKRLMVTCAATVLVALSFIGHSDQAEAQFNIQLRGVPFIGGPGFYIGPPGHNGRRNGRRGGRNAAPSNEDSASDDPGPRKGRDDKVTVSAGAPSSAEQTRVLQKIASSATVTDVGSTKDLTEAGQQTLANDKNRDYTTKIKDIIDEFKKEERKGREEARRESRGETREMTPGDVTAHGIEQSLEKAVKNAKLDVFERFVNEAWTSERLRVLILDRVLVDIRPLFQGNNRGKAPMEALDSLIQRAADAVYRRIFETSEFLAANKSSVLFMQRLYQTHGALVDNDLRESAGGMLSKASMAAVGPYETAMRRDPNGYALRYRAQRIIFDCLSENVEKVTSSETRIATVGEIERKIASTSNSVCGAWLQNQFGVERGELKPQKPMPMRVIWSATGPKDDPSMYGRVTF